MSRSMKAFWPALSLSLLLAACGGDDEPELLAPSPPAASPDLFAELKRIDGLPADPQCKNDGLWDDSLEDTESDRARMDQEGSQVWLVNTRPTAGGPDLRHRYPFTLDGNRLNGPPPEHHKHESVLPDALQPGTCTFESERFYDGGTFTVTETRADGSPKQVDWNKTLYIHVNNRGSCAFRDSNGIHDYAENCWKRYRAHDGETEWRVVRQ